MMTNVMEDIELLCSMPSLGRQIPTKGKREYRVFVSRKKCLLKYWYDDNMLYVVNVIFTDTHSQRMF